MVSIRQLSAALYDDALADGRRMYLEGPSSQPSYAPLAGPIEAGTIAMCVFIVEDAKQEHLYEEHPHEREWDAMNVHNTAQVLEEAAKELRRLGALLDGPQPLIEP